MDLLEAGDGIVVGYERSILKQLRRSQAVCSSAVQWGHRRGTTWPGETWGDVGSNIVFANVGLRSSDDMEMCSLKVLQLEGSPSRMLLGLMGERGCTTGHLIDYLQTLGNSEALQCLKPSGTVNPSTHGWSLFNMLRLTSWQKITLHLQCFNSRWNSVLGCQGKHPSVSLGF